MNILKDPNIFYALLILAVALTGVNTYLLTTSTYSTVSTGSIGTFAVGKSTGDKVQDAINAIIATGTPDYGAALGVSYDQPVQGLQVLSALDNKIPTNSLTADELKRYAAIDTQISCEFCCSAPAVIDSSGRALCGCSHSMSIRGLTKWLLQNQPQLTDDQILGEVTKWKSLYYPRNMVEKAVALLNNGQPLTPQALNDRQLLSKLSAGDLGSIGSLPQMVGGC